MGYYLCNSGVISERYSPAILARDLRRDAPSCEIAAPLVAPATFSTAGHTARLIAFVDRRTIDGLPNAGPLLAAQPSSPAHLIRRDDSLVLSQQRHRLGPRPFPRARPRRLKITNDVDQRRAELIKKSAHLYRATRYSFGVSNVEWHLIIQRYGKMRFPPLDTF